MTKTVGKMLREAARHDDFWQQWLINDFTEELARRLDVLRISRSAFAEKIGSTPPYVTRVLRGEENLTAATMSKLARAVGSVVRVHLAPLGTYSVWLDFSDNAAGQRPIHAANCSTDAFDAPQTKSEFGARVMSGTATA